MPFYQWNENDYTPVENKRLFLSRWFIIFFALLAIHTRDLYYISDTPRFIDVLNFTVIVFSKIKSRKGDFFTFLKQTRNYMIKLLKYCQGQELLFQRFKMKVATMYLESFSTELFGRWRFFYHLFINANYLKRITYFLIYKWISLDSFNGYPYFIDPVVRYHLIRAIRYEKDTKSLSWIEQKMSFFIHRFFN